MSITSPAIETLFNDVDKDTASRLSASLVPHAILAFESPAPRPALVEPAYEEERAFLRCTRDQALPIVVQDMFVQRNGVNWDIRNLDAGHSPYINQSKEFFQAIIGLAASFEGS